jgi:ferric-dicitrate binding protein FerR (iron transport regulator)
MQSRRTLWPAGATILVVALLGGAVSSVAQTASSAAYLEVVRGPVGVRTTPGESWLLAADGVVVASGSAVWTQPPARAALRIGFSTLWLDSGTEVDIDRLSQQAVSVTVPYGEVYMHVHGVARGTQFNVRTPRGDVAIAGDGRYEISAGDADHLTTVSVLDGQARLAGNGLQLLVAAGNTAFVTGTPDGEKGSIGKLDFDDFLRGSLSRERGSSTQPTPPLAFQSITGGPGLGPHAGPPLQPMGPPPLPVAPLPFNNDAPPQFLSRPHF